MKRIGIFVLAAMLFMIANVAGAKTIVFLGGQGDEISYMGYMEKNILPSCGKRIVIVPRRLWTFADAATDTWQQIQNQLLENGAAIDEELIIVGHSWGGLIARRIAADHPESVIAVVTIVSPNGGYRFCPRWIFNPWDKESNVPLYVVAAYKEELGERWFFRGPNDGVVDVVSMLDVGRKATGSVVLAGLDHMEVLQSKIVADIINHWIEPLKEDAPQTQTAMASLD